MGYALVRRSMFDRVKHKFQPQPTGLHQPLRFDGAR